MQFNAYFSRVYSTAKIGIKMHALSCVSSQLLASVPFIGVHTYSENPNFFVNVIFHVMQLYSYMHSYLQ